MPRLEACKKLSKKLRYVVEIVVCVRLFNPLDNDLKDAFKQQKNWLQLGDGKTDNSIEGF